MSSIKINCDNYTDLLYARETLKNECFRCIDDLKSLQVSKYDKEKLQAKLNVQIVLREFIQKLHEKIELLKLIIEDMGREYIKSQQDFLIVDQVLSIQEKALQKIEKENRKIEESVNGKVATMREKFSKQFIELRQSQQLYEVTRKELEDSCRQQSQLENELKQAKLQHHSCVCQIESIQKAKSADESPTTKMFDELAAKHVKLSKIVANSKSYTDCVRQKICHLQRETGIVRETVKTKLKISKLHDEWSTDQLLTQKQELEEAKRKFNETTDDSDKIIQNLRSEISLLTNKIDESQNAIRNLQNLLRKALENELKCKKVIKPSSRGQPTSSKKLTESSSERNSLNELESNLH